MGKILRLDADGSIPTDNPFSSTATGANRAIWALGLRNPFTFDFSSTGRMYVNDVGQDSWEEVNDGIAGWNYAWPATEGATTDPRFRSPVYAYGHTGTAVTGCAIRAGRSTTRRRRGTRATTWATTSSPTIAATGSRGATRPAP
jgi:glucose/arabinose dehydrogenase